MRLSLWPDTARTFDQLLAIAGWADRIGWHRLYLADHFMPNRADGAPHDGPVLECFASLAALSAATSRIGLGSLVAGNPYRHPAVVANTAATISQISGGRFALGLGAGWQQNECRAFGIDLDTVPVRLDRFEEAVEITTSLLRESRTTFSGEHYQLQDAPCEPKPAGPLPLIIGGKGERRTMRIAARFADEWNGWCTPSLLTEKVRVLDRHCGDRQRILRDPEVDPSIPRTRRPRWRGECSKRRPRRSAVPEGVRRPGDGPGPRLHRRRRR